MLDERLKEAINKKSGDILIIGPPGSGKTYTLLKLTEYLINTEKIKPEKILIFCFNRKWSKLIREQTTSLVNKSILEIPIETFYSFCTRFISRPNFLLSQNRIQDNKNHYIEKNNEENNKNIEDYSFFGDLKVLNSVQQWELLKSIIRELDKEKYPYTFKYMNYNTFTENSYIQEIFDFILRGQENLLTPEDLLNKFTPFFNPVLSELSGIYSRYIKELKRNSLYNYGMLLEETVNILKNSKEIRDYYKNYYEYILVDELQEINKAQFSIIKYLSNSNCIFFGNDDQSIYAFRGSTQNIFRMTYKKLEPENVIYLKKNYRNSYFINETCNKFIELIKDRIPKEAASTDVTGDTNIGGELHLKEFQTLLEEANYISREIKSLYFKKGIKLEEMAIIIKGLGYETHIIENSLSMNGIPFIRRGTRNLFDNKLIKYLLNFMRFLITVKKIEDLKKGQSSSSDSNGSDINNDLITELNFLVENLMLSEFINLEPLYFKKLEDLYMKERENSGSLWDCFKTMFVERAEKRNKKGNKSNVKNLKYKELEITAEDYKKNKNLNYYDIKNKDREHLKIINFVSTTYRLLEIMDTMNALEFSLSLVRDSGTGVMNYLKAINISNDGADNNKSNNISDRSSWINLGDFLNNVKDFSIKNIPGDITSYINFVDNVIESKFTEEIEESTKDMIQPGAVNIFSFHQCKGLEFKVVFIPFVNKDYLPAKFVFNSIYNPGIFNQASDVKNSDIAWLKKEHMYGEIRLFYNGITRARDYLYITSTGRRKSIFFEEMRKISESLGSDLHCIGGVRCRSIDGHKNDKSDKNTVGKEEKEEKGNAENKKTLAGLKVAAEQSEVATEQNVKIPGASSLDSLLDDIDLTNIWLARRKALVAVSRMQNKLKINYKSYRNHIIFLKHFYNPGTWWDFIMPTRNDKNPFDFSGQSFSFSSIDTFTDCPLKYKAKYYFSLKEEEDISLIIGKIYHEIIRIFFNGGDDYSWERLEKIIDDIFEESNFDFKFLKKDFKENALIQFKNFFENLMPSDPQNSITEKEFSFNIGSENITGRIDQINIISDRDIEIVDYKSGSSSYSDRELKEELQLKTYRMAVDVSEDLIDFKSMNVKMKYICLGNLRKSLYIVPEEYYSRDEISHRLGESISAIKKEEFKAKPGNYNSCTNCGFKILCPRYYG
jgi:superfamily I DNA/RNA helicase/CRISPR/Cas system-associated exonuclease Cas4 (RecB family)